MRLAVISDIHGNLPALEAALADMQGCGDFDQVWCLGDLAALGGQPVECLDRLRELRAQLGDDAFQVIGGNTDRYLVTGERMGFPPPKEASAFPAYRDNILSMSAMNAWAMTLLSWEDFDFLRSLIGRELRLHAPGYGAVIGIHAIPGDDESLALRPDSPAEEAEDALLDREGQLALCGHTHLALDRQLGPWRVINPGSVGLSFGHPGWAEWALLEWRNGKLRVELRRVPYDVEATLREWERLGHPRMAWIRPRLG